MEQYDIKSIFLDQMKGYEDHVCHDCNAFHCSSTNNMWIFLNCLRDIKIHNWTKLQGLPQYHTEGIIKVSLFPITKGNPKYIMSPRS